MIPSKIPAWLSVLVAGIFYPPSLFAATGGEPPVEPPIDLLSQGVEVAGYLLLLIIFAVIAVRLGRHFQPRMGPGGLIRVEDGHNLAPGVGVRLIRVGSRAWLVGVTREQVSLIAEMSEEEMRPAKERAL